MKKIRSIFTFLLLVLLLGSTAAIAQQKEGPIEFNVGEFHTMNVVTEAPLLWDENINELVTLNISMASYPTNESRIEIQLIQFFAVESRVNAVPQLQGSNTTEISLNTNTRSVLVNQYLSPPISADRFYINITIIAFPVGGGAVQEATSYSYRFPESSTIIVERDELVPLVNLYGFPAGSFFRIWFPIYIIAIMLLSTPGIIFAAVKVKEVTQDRRESSMENDEVDGQNTEEEVVIDE